MGFQLCVHAALLLFCVSGHFRRHRCRSGLRKRTSVSESKTWSCMIGYFVPQNGAGSYGMAFVCSLYYRDFSFSCGAFIIGIPNSTPIVFAIAVPLIVATSPSIILAGLPNRKKNWNVSEATEEGLTNRAHIAGRRVALSKIMSNTFIDEKRTLWLCILMPFMAWATSVVPTCTNTRTMVFTLVLPQIELTMCWRYWRRSHQQSS